jgi:hypothetical protein
MTGYDVCAEVRELLPDHAAGRLGSVPARLVREHVSACAECAEELALISLLLDAAPSVPGGLSDRVVRAVTTRRRPAHRPWWGLSAAAAAAVALGIGIRSDQGGVPAPAGTDFASEFEEGEFFVSDDAMLAGAPSLDELTDDELAELLEELTSDAPGGQA